VSKLFVRAQKHQSDVKASGNGVHLPAVRKRKGKRGRGTGPMRTATSKHMKLRKQKQEIERKKVEDMKRQQERMLLHAERQNVLKELHNGVEALIKAYCRLKFKTEQRERENKVLEEDLQLLQLEANSAKQIKIETPKGMENYFNLTGVDQDKILRLQDLEESLKQQKNRTSDMFSYSETLQHMLARLRKSTKLFDACIGNKEDLIAQKKSPN